MSKQSNKVKFGLKTAIMQRQPLTKMAVSLTQSRSASPVQSVFLWMPTPHCRNSSEEYLLCAR